MEIKEFSEKLKNALEKKLGEEYRLETVEVPKNNGVLLQGLTIQRVRHNLAPTIYVNGFWEAYKEGTPLARIADRILEILQQDAPSDDIDMSFFGQFDKVKSRICYRVINAEKNAALLQRIPHRLFLDLAVCFFYAYEGQELGKGSILIHNTHVEQWNTTTEELWELALANTERLYPWENKSMDVVIRELLTQKNVQECHKWEEELPREPIPMYVLSNTDRVYGAACVLYTELLHKLAQQLDADFYILPSSVHEVILLPDTHQDSPLQLRKMIQEINDTQLEPQEILSYQLYYYKRTEGKIRMLG